MKLTVTQLTRNRQGQPVLSEQTLQSDPLRIGRGADCKLHLPDPRVSLHHATMGLSDDGTCFIEAAAGSIKIDGRFERSMRLRAGQKIRVGPFEMIILPTPPNVDLALSVELVDPLKDDLSDIRANLKTGLTGTWLSKRTLSWVAGSAIAFIFLLWPVMNALNTHDREANAKLNIPPDASWNPGPLASAHHSFGRDCAQCHATPFVQTQNEQCESCHKSIGWHFALDSKTARSLHESVFMKSAEASRCAACHRDHKGPLGLIRQDSPLCTQCHADLKTRHPETTSPNIADFSRDHPAFKLSMLVPGKTGQDAVVRIAQDSHSVETSNLKFPHDIHLAKKGIRGPASKVTMTCKNCHVPDENGIRFKPTTMREHCQDCHSLEFEPKASNRQVPHGNVDDVMATLREFYARAALADTPIDVVVQDGVRRPGERLSSAKRESALKWATQKAEKTGSELMEDRVCFACHEIRKVNGSDEKAHSWKIAPIAITQHWLPKTRFPHNKHNTKDCNSCHQVEASKVSSDIAIPDIKNCRECHGGNSIAVDKAPGTCETCHGFHVGGPKSGIPIQLPGVLPYDTKDPKGLNPKVRLKIAHLHEQDKPVTQP